MSGALALLALALVAASALARGHRGLVVVRAWGGRAERRRRRARRAGPARRREGIRGPELALLVAEVAARLRAGSPLEEAWRAAWVRIEPGEGFEGIDEDGAPRALARIGTAPALLEARCFSDLARIRWARSPSGRAAARAALALRAACRLSATSGAPLAEVLDAIADGLDESEAAEEARRIAAQGARTSSRLLRALPLLGIAGAQILGADPLGRFLDGGIGTALGLVGAALLIAASLVSAGLVARAAAQEGRLDPAISCDLARSALEAGASIPGVLESLGGACGDGRLARAGRGLRLGLEWGPAWEDADEGALARALEPAWTSGVAPDDLLARTAARIRRRRLADARARAEALGVELAVPLAALLLPAFLALGLGPVLLSLVEGGFGGLV